MKKITRAASILLLSFCVSTALAKNFSAKNKRLIARKIDAIVKTHYPNLNIGLDIRTANNKHIIYQRNAEHLYVPASNLKLLTAETALLYLGQSFRFNTRLFIDGTVTQNTLHGDVYIYFDGDPTLSSHDLQLLISALKSHGIQTIKGNAYIDNSAFDNKNIGPGWMWDELRFCYAAPINAVIINQNCMPFILSPAKRLGQPVGVHQSTGTHFFTVINHAKTTNKHRALSCPLEMDINESNQVVMSGCLSQRQKKVGLEAAVFNVHIYSHMAIENLLRHAHIHITGTIKNKKIPTAPTLIAEHHSAPLSAILKTMLKKSDNLLANAIFKKIGQRYYKKQGTWKNSQAAMSDILRKYDHLSAKDLIAVDGSGLSRYSLVTPQALSRLLTGAYKRPYFNFFKNALPTSGIDGTLKYRMGTKQMIRKVHAKTGTMSSVSSLSGYVETRHYGTLVFSILINGYQGKAYPYRALEDKIVTELAGL